MRSSLSEFAFEHGRQQMRTYNFKSTKRTDSPLPDGYLLNGSITIQTLLTGTRCLEHCDIVGLITKRCRIKVIKATTHHFQSELPPNHKFHVFAEIFPHQESLSHTMLSTTRISICLRRKYGPISITYPPT